MLFNSFEFLLFFLPSCLGVLLGLARVAPRASVSFLLVMSIVFYAGWSANSLPLLCASILFNYFSGRSIGMAAMAGQPHKARALLVGGIAVNLIVLGYYKYVGFLASAFTQATGISLAVHQVDLPLGISFFTFTQIAFLVDAAKGKTAELNLFRYGLFVTYFPHLIAGPILHHREMMSQFERPGAFRLRTQYLAAGTTLFAIGLFKKVVIADTLAPTANAVFGAASKVALTVAESWSGALAYTLQLYFDFSGYSDMALGLALMMGVRMPLNFNSPYKATNIIDFWRRWHITLSRFLRDYLYIPLGGNRHGRSRRYVNLMATMVIGGLWHGAGWTFVLWGGLHGVYLTINHAWHAAPAGIRRLMPRSVAWLLTFVAVIVAWVFFRSSSVGEATTLLSAMAGGNGLAMPVPLARLMAPVLGPLAVAGSTFGNALFDVTVALPQIAAALVVALVAPNSQELLARYRPALTDTPIRRISFVWRASWTSGAVVGGILVVSPVMLSGDSPFLYFRF